MASGLPSSFAVGCPSVALFLLFFQLGTTAVGSPFIVLCCITCVFFSHRMSTSFSLLYTQSLVLLQCFFECLGSIVFFVARIFFCGLSVVTLFRFRWLSAGARTTAGCHNNNSSSRPICLVYTAVSTMENLHGSVHYGKFTQESLTLIAHSTCEHTSVVEISVLTPLASFCFQWSQTTIFAAGRPPNSRTGMTPVNCTMTFTGRNTEQKPWARQR